MPDRTQSWEELISSDKGIRVIVVSMSGAFQWPRSFGFGSRRVIVVDHYERIGSMVAVATLDIESGQRFGNVIAREMDICPRFFSSERASDDSSVPRIFQNETVDGRDICIDAPGGIRLCGFRGPWTTEETLSGCRRLAEAMSA